MFYGLRIMGAAGNNVVFPVWKGLNIVWSWWPTSVCVRRLFSLASRLFLIIFKFVLVAGNLKTFYIHCYSDPSFLKRMQWKSGYGCRRKQRRLSCLERGEHAWSYSGRRMFVSVGRFAFKEDCFTSNLYMNVYTSLL